MQFHSFSLLKVHTHDQWLQHSISNGEQSRLHLYLFSTDHQHCDYSTS